MKIMIYSILIFALIICLFLIILSIVSRKHSETGIVDGRLKPCPDTPNCVCSEYQDSPHFIEAFEFADDSASAFKRIKKAIRDIGGKIEYEQNGYLGAAFTTAIFRFKDDLEVRIDTGNKRIHIRSASRVGHSDLGTNRKRVSALRKAFNQIKIQN